MVQAKRNYNFFLKLDLEFFVTGTVEVLINPHGREVILHTPSILPLSRLVQFH